MILSNNSFPASAACSFDIFPYCGLSPETSSFFFRVKIVKEKALPEIENYMFEEHDQIRQAATECMCNLITCKEVRPEKQ